MDTILFVVDNHHFVNCAEHVFNCESYIFLICEIKVKLRNIISLTTILGNKVFMRYFTAFAVFERVIPWKTVSL